MLANCARFIDRRCEGVTLAFREVNEARHALREVLEWYADPATYFAIGFLLDPPCGEFETDFSEDHDDETLPGPRPGKRAREALRANPFQCLEKP
jgi:hypothetical protein